MVCRSSPACRNLNLIFLFRFPQYLREKVQSCLTLAWTFRTPIVQKTSPAQLVASTLYHVLANSVTDYTFVDFCAGAGGPTPYIEQDLNAKLTLTEPKSPTITNGDALRSSQTISQPAANKAVKFFLTDLHPHIPDWTEA